MSKKYSINPYSQKKFLVPENSDDSEKIDKFLSNHKEKKIIVVQGLGFVGAVMSLVCANSDMEDYAVIGVDIADENNFWKIQSINEGMFPLIAEDPKIEEFFMNARSKNNFYATYDPYVYSLADVIIVDINLDVQKVSGPLMELDSFEVDLENFKNAIKSIGENCKEDTLILIETTVPPGTCKEIVLPILTESLSKRDLKTDQIMIGHSYERVMPGPNYIDSIKNFYRVFSGINKKSEDATKKFLETIISIDEYPLTKLGSTNATEMAKVLENSYRAMNIAFMVEWSRFAEEAEVNLYEVINAIKMRPTHSNIMYPGVGVGGYCLTKDPLMASWARQNLIGSSNNLSQSERSVAINDQMPKYAFDYFKREYNSELREKNVLFLGISYRGDVGDTRSTPVALLYDLFISHGCNLTLHDPYIKFWEEKNESVYQSIEEIVDMDFDIVVISAGHSIYKSQEFLDQIFHQRDLFIFDTIGHLKEEDIRILNTVNIVKVLGRGDI